MGSDMRDFDDCRPYVEHLRLEHEHLHDVLRRLQSQLSELCRCEQQRQAQVQGFVTSLCDLRAELMRHFAEEEEGGCLEEAESRSPSVAAEVKRVRAEHAMLRKEMDRLADSATALLDAPRGLASIYEDFVKLAAAIRNHEAAENRILLYGFGAEAMDEIMEEPTTAADAAQSGGA